MTHKNKILEDLLSQVKKRLNGREDIKLPPPVFDTMQGVFVSFDTELNELKIRYPVLSEYLNPFGAMQGGVISTIIDNTIGPLSMLVAPPSMTREMTVKYIKPVLPKAGDVYVTAKFSEENKRKLIFDAVLENEAGETLATAKSFHLIIGQ